MEKLTADKVNETFLSCLFRSKDDAVAYVKASGVVSSVGFDPQSLAKNKEKIHEFLLQLPKEFQQDSGGGYSFLAACNDKDGVQWTGLHKDMEELFLLGLATGYVQCLMPRNMWPVLPGGMPYYTVLNEPVAVEITTA